MHRPVCTIVGVGPGIGLAVAERFGREGFQLALVARRASSLTQYAIQLGAKGIMAEDFPANAGNAASLQTAFGLIQQQLGPTDVLIYNAIAVHPGPPSTLDSTAVMQDFAVNVVGALVAAQQVIPAMQTAGRGTILFTGGGLALDPNPAYASLAIGKAGVRNLAHSLAAELEPAGIHVATITICGYVQPGTPFAPERIAEAYWRLHRQPRDQWEHEIMFRGE